MMVSTIFTGFIDHGTRITEEEAMKIGHIIKLFLIGCLTDYRGDEESNDLRFSELGKGPKHSIEKLRET